MAVSVYDDNPARAQVPLTSEEVDALLLTDGSFFTKDPRRIRHLLTRMRAAFGHHIDQMRNLQRDIEEINASVRVRATPMSAALDALRQLSLHEQRQVFEMRGQALVDLVTQARADADRTRTAATSEANRTRFAFSRVMQDPDIPAEVKAKLQDALMLLPDAVHQAAWEPVDAPVPEDGSGGFQAEPASSAGEDNALASLFEADDPGLNW